MIQTKMHQFIKGCSKFKPKNKIQNIILVYASVLLTGCQTVQTLSAILITTCLIYLEDKRHIIRQNNFLQKVTKYVV